ncbi:MAG: hypothetical protein DRG31_06110, partial [Deltaproteobacteria bacterium]
YGGIYNFTGKSRASGSFNGSWTYFWEMRSLEMSEEVNITYYINGTGEFLVEEMFIVGVDPVQTNRLAATRQILSLDGFTPTGSSPEDVAAPLGIALMVYTIFTARQPGPRKKRRR